MNTFLMRCFLVGTGLFVAGPVGAEPTAVHLGATTESVAERIQQVKRKQTAVDESQRTIATRLGFIRRQAAAVLELQQAARQAQQAADEAQGTFEHCLGQIRWLAQDIERHKPKLDDLAKSIQETERQLSDLLTAIPPAEQEAAAAAEAAQQAREAYENNRTRAGRGDYRRAADKARKLDRKLEGIRKKIGQLQRTLDAQRKRADKLRQQCLERRRQIKTINDEQLGSALAVAAQTQENALQAQQTAYEALKALQSLEPELKPNADSGPDDTEGTIAAADLVRMNLPELMATAVQTEATITRIYKEGKAAELAMIREIPRSAAAETIDVHTPFRLSLDLDKLAAANTPAQMDAYKAELRKAAEQMDAMTSRGYELLAGARGEGAEVTLATITAAVGTGQALEGAALDDVNVRAKDLTVLMNAAYGNAPGSGPRGAAGGLLTAAPSYGAGGAAANVNPFDDALGGPPRRRQRLHPGESSDVESMLAAVPGRRIQSGLPRGEWMYVDSWYLIGPFPNPQRRNIERRFPPETVVDLDAVYEGKDNRPVRWEFVQTGVPVVRFTEAYAIYYAYTELWFEEPMECWVALGTDDGCRLYINDLLVWKTTELKAWQVNEACRKVSFKKGRNRLLYQIENAPNHGWFSFIIHTQP